MSKSNFMYPGRGKQARQVNGSTGNVLTIPESFIIPDGGYSEVIPVFQVNQLIAEFLFGAAATGDVITEQVSDQNASGGGTTLDTTTVAASLTGGWSSRYALNGYLRFKNSSGQTLQIYYNKQISS